MGWDISHGNYFISWIYVNGSQTYMCRVDMSVRFMSTHVINTLSFRLYMSHFPTGLVSSKKKKLVAMTFAPTFILPSLTILDTFIFSHHEQVYRTQKSMHFQTHVYWIFFSCFGGYYHLSKHLTLLTTFKNHFSKFSQNT